MKPLKYFTIGPNKKHCIYPEWFLNCRLWERSEWSVQNTIPSASRVAIKWITQPPEAVLVQCRMRESLAKQYNGSTAAMPVRYNYQHFMRQSRRKTRYYFQKADCRLLHVRTDDDCERLLQQFLLNETRVLIIARSGKVIRSWEGITLFGRDGQCCPSCCAVVICSRWRRLVKHHVDKTGTYN